MDKVASSSRGRAQVLFEKTIELENKRRKSAQARTPSDPSLWPQIRENYEAIILEDHAFSEQNNIEYALWQLHYKRIEEFRAHFSAAVASTSSNTSQNVKGPTRPDRIMKIRLQFKTFLSEASGFYHDLILKIRSKYGLPLGNFFDESDALTVADRDGKKSTDIKKGVVSCHRCLIYLGDLARYKGLYGEGDSKTREYAAASSYYLQAASLWPSSGNPHHQLAIVASYSGDELSAVYRYFRSLAVESPFSTARDNLIVVFEKNRVSYSQLPVSVKESPARLTGKGRGKGEAKLASKDADIEDSLVNEKVPDGRYKTFCVRFVRLNGVLFTRTSLETFPEVLTSVSNGLAELLSSGPEEELNFGVDAVENGQVFVKLVSLLIFMVYNSKREVEGQTYAEIVQRAVLVKSALHAIFELMGVIVARCVQLRDPSSSYLLPCILVFLEWSACYPDISTGSDLEEKQATARSRSWNHFISFFNRTLLIEPMSIDDDKDESCFFNMSRYDEGETENRLALWEDFELRGFLPLLPAHTILDFSRKHVFGGDGSREKKVRLKRIIAAGKALSSVIRVDNKTVFFDSLARKFLIGVQPSDDALLTSKASSSETDKMIQDQKVTDALRLATAIGNKQVYMDGEDDDDDEVIVFKPVVTERSTEGLGPKYVPNGVLKKPECVPNGVLKKPVDQGASTGDLQFYAPLSPALENLHQQLDATSRIPVLVGNLPQHMQPVQPHPLKWSAGEDAYLASSFSGLQLSENGHVTNQEMPGNVSNTQFSALSMALNQPFNVSTSGMLFNQPRALESAQSRALESAQSRALEAAVISKTDVVASSGVFTESMAVNTPAVISSGVRKNPVSRPVRHLGPPPGFNSVPPKQVNEPIYSADLKSGNPLSDDYSWLDGYQPPSMNGSGIRNPISYPSCTNIQYNGSSNILNGTANFPFPGKQVSKPQLQGEVEKWHPYQALEQMQLQREQLLQQQQQQHQQQQQLANGSQQYNPLPEQQYQGQPVWNGRYFV